MIYVFDNLLEDFDHYYNNVKKATFKDIVSQGQKYSDISQDVLPVMIYDSLSKRLPFKTADVLSFLRAYRDLPEYRHPMWIHSDALFSDWLAVFMIQSSEFKQDDGVSVWKNKELDSHFYFSNDINDPNAKLIDSQSLDPEKWEIYKRIEFKPNRLVMMPAHFFHAKSSYGNYGKTYDDCRIVHVLFFNGGKNA